MIKLMIAIPTVDYIHFKFLECLTKLMKRLDQIEDLTYNVEIKGGTLVYFARDDLANKALEGDYTHVLWLDADMIFGDDIFEKLYDLCQKENVEFATGVYRGRHGDNNSCIFMDLHPLKYVERLWEIDEPFEIMGCGFGGVLLTTKMLRRIHYEEATSFRPINGWGEDLSFCLRAKDYGNFKMMAHPGVNMGHIAQTILNPDRTVNYI